MVKNPRIVILRGKPTSGKSTAFQSLRNNPKMKGWIFVDHPALKRWFEKVNTEQGIGEVMKKSLYSALNELFITSKNIIMEETARETLLKYSGDKIKKYNYQIIIFQFEVDLKNSKIRDVIRVSKKEGIHTKVLGSRLKTLHQMHNERFDPKAILIDTNKLNKKQVVNLILNKIS